MKKNSTTTISNGKFAAYVAAGAASGFGMVGTAEADISYFVGPIAVEDTTTGDGGIGFQLDLGDASSFNIDFAHQLNALPPTPAGVAFLGALFTATQNPLGAASVAGFTAGGFNYASNIAAGANLSAITNWILPAPTKTMAFGPGYGNDQFLAAGQGFIGLRFNNGSGFAYGWVRVTMSGAPKNSYVIEDFAYADPNEALQANQSVVAVPEPGSLAALALGAVGMAAFRRRRSAA